MDAKQIAQIDQQKASQTQQRNTLSNQDSEQGFAFLAQALGTPTLAEQKPLLKQACDAFAAGIRSQRSNPEPYIGFAYVLMLLGNTDKALGFVKEAQRLQPDHEDVALLMAEVKHRASLKPAAQTRNAASKPSFAGGRAAVVVTKIDYDALYEQLDREIMVKVKSLMTAPLVEPKASVDPGHLARLDQQIQAIKKQLAHFEHQLKILEEEIDTVELSLKLKPLEGLLRNFQKALQASGILNSLYQEMTAQLRLMIQILKETRLSTDPEDVAIVEENLEEFLDRMDGFANGLDDLEAQGHEITSAMQRYHSLLAVVEDLQDALEELKLKSVATSFS